MRILFVTPAYPPFAGGGERYARALAQYLVAHGHGVTVVTSSARYERDFWQPDAAARRSFDESDGGVRVIRCPLRGMPGGRTALLAWRKAMVLCSALPGNQSPALFPMARRVPFLSQLEPTLDGLTGAFDLVNGFNISWEAPLVAAWQWTTRRKLPLVIAPFAHLGRGFGDRVARNSTMDHQRLMLSRAAAVLALTETEREGLAKWNIHPAIIEVLGAGLDPLPDTADVPYVLTKYQLEPNFAIFVGRATYDKGALHAAHAVIRMREKGLKPTLVLVGPQSPDFSRFHNRLSETERRYVRPVGIVSEAEKHALLEASSMLVLPSKTDSFGIVMLEAWAHEKPVIGARAGGIPGVVDDGENGLLVSFGDVQALSEAMYKLLADPARSQRMGQLGHQKVSERYTWDRVGSQLVELYERVLGSG